MTQVVLVTRTEVGDVLRLFIPNLLTSSALPPGTLLEITHHFAEEPQACLGRVKERPDVPQEYHVIVPKGATVVVEEA